MLSAMVTVTSSALLVFVKMICESSVLLSHSQLLHCCSLIHSVLDHDATALIGYHCAVGMFSIDWSSQPSLALRPVVKYKHIILLHRKSGIGHFLFLHCSIVIMRLYWSQCKCKKKLLTN